MSFGIDVGGTTIKYGEVSESGEILHKGSVPTPATEGPEAVVRAIVACVGSFANAQDDAIGVAFPSVVHNGTTYNCPNIPGFHGFDLQGALADAMPGTHVVIENDANAAALAEAKLGAGKEYPDFLYVTLGTGVGGGVILNGQIYRGPHGDAGEIGHVIVQGCPVPSAECLVPGTDSTSTVSYRQGVLEEFVGAPAITRRYNEAPGTRHQAPGTVLDINERAMSGEPLAIKILEETGYWLGIGLCSALTTLGLRVVVVGGGVSMSDIILEGALATIRERAIPSIAENIVLKRAHFLNDTGIVGASMLTLSIR